VNLSISSIKKARLRAGDILFVRSKKPVTRVLRMGIQAKLRSMLNAVGVKDVGIAVHGPDFALSVMSSQNKCTCPAHYDHTAVGHLPDCPTWKGNRV